MSTSTRVFSTSDATAADWASPRIWMCLICGWVYDEAEGLPDEGIPAGTRWEDVPSSWTCPDCGAGKNDFEMTLIQS